MPDAVSSMDRGGSITPKAARSGQLESPVAAPIMQTLEATNVPTKSAMGEAPDDSDIRDLSVPAEVGDLTLKEGLHPNVTAEGDAILDQIHPTADTGSSDELERICESIWSLFGDSLRYVAVDREGASYQETLRILGDLSLGGKRHDRTSGGDESMTSYSSDSQATVATTGSSSSSHLENAGPPQPAMAVAAHVLQTLLTTPPPHVMDIEELKGEAEAWWDREGRQAYMSSLAGRESAGEIGEGTSSDLASRAVFRLVAKKILRLQFRGAKRIISFPAHIG